MKKYRAVLEFDAEDDRVAWILARQLAEQPQGRVVEATLAEVQDEYVVWTDVAEPKDTKTAPLPFEPVASPF